MVMVTKQKFATNDLIHGLILASKVDFDHPINLGSNKEISLNKLLGILRLDKI